MSCCRKPTRTCSRPARQPREEIRSIRAFALTVARNVALSWLRHRQVVPIELVADMEQLELLDERGQVDEIVNTHQELALLTAAVARLPARCRQVFTLRKVYGLSRRRKSRRSSRSPRTPSSSTSPRACACAALRWRLRRSLKGARPGSNARAAAAERRMSADELIEQQASRWLAQRDAGADAATGSRSSIVAAGGHPPSRRLPASRSGLAARRSAARSAAAGSQHRSRPAARRRAATGRWPWPPACVLALVLAGGCFVAESQLRLAAVTKRASAASRASCSTTAASST